ncbi:MAG: hypothetical protein HY301_13080 [Verrucomicrobia bacterium]|nr:hypothetical protein [Verrucomicrobiota bacterium]
MTKQSWTTLGLLGLALLAALPAVPGFAADADRNRLRELREKSVSGNLTAEELAELERSMSALGRSRSAGPPAPAGTNAARPSAQPATTPEERAKIATERRAQYEERQELSFARLREFQKTALAAAAARPVPTGLAREFFVNNESGSDAAAGLAPDQAVRTLAKAVSLLKPGDTLHLAVTREPYRESLKLNDGFGGVPGKPITIDGHGATITGSDPLRTDGWVEAGAPGLFKSAKLLGELEEFGDAAKLMRVFFLFDGVMQHMGRSSKGAHAHFKSPASLQPGEWTYVEAEKSFYVKVAGQLADAKIEAPYRRNGVAVRTPKEALTGVVIKNLIVCHVLNDGFNLHGTSRDFLLQNIAAYECGDDGISPHETCEVTIDGFWSIGNSTGMGNGYLSVTKASNVRLEGNLAHQFMTGHAPVTELHNAVIVATKGTQPVNISNSQDTRLLMDNVQIISPAGQKIVVVPKTVIEARRLTVVGPDWEIAGKVRVSQSALGSGKIVCVDGGGWEGSKNVFDPAATIPAGEAGATKQPVNSKLLSLAGPPFPGTGADPSEFKIPPRPVPHPRAGKFDSPRPLPSSNAP